MCSYIGVLVTSSRKEKRERMTEIKGEFPLSENGRLYTRRQRLLLLLRLLLLRAHHTWWHSKYASRLSRRAICASCVLLCARVHVCMCACMCACVCIQHVSRISASEDNVNESPLPLLSPPNQLPSDTGRLKCKSCHSSQ